MSERLGFEKHYNVEVAGAIGRIIFDHVPMSWEEAKSFWDQGIPVPLEIVPKEFWREPGQEFPRYGEEMLGSEF